MVSARPSTIACCSRSAASVKVASPAGVTPNTANGPTFSARIRCRPMRMVGGNDPAARAYTCQSSGRWALCARRLALGLRRAVIWRKQSVGCAKQRGQTNEHQVHVCEREDEIRVQDHSLIQQVIDDVEQRRIALIDDAGNRARRRSGTWAQGLWRLRLLRLRRWPAARNSAMSRAPRSQGCSPCARSATKL